MKGTGMTRRELCYGLRYINRNIVYPTLFYDPIHNNEIAQTGIEIIEITSDDELNVEELNSNNQNTTCQFKNTIENNFTSNGTSEAVKCMGQEQTRNFKRCHNNTTAFNRACSEFYGIDCSNKGSIFPPNHIFSFRSSSSSETPDGLNMNQFSDTSDECWNSDATYDSHKAYDTIKNSNKESIWNDCQKDIHFLYQNNESYIIPSQETSFSNSTDEDEQNYNNTIRRIATPIPTYMPRLNLPSSPTLPTLTEVCELSKTPINLAEDIDASALVTKSVNNWFNADLNAKEIVTKENKYVKQGNRLSTLLEREKRRIKLKEIKELEVLQEQYSKPVNLEKNENCNSLKQIDKTASETFLNNNDVANELQESQTKTSSISSQITKVSDPNEIINGNCKSNENSNESDVIEVYECDLNTTPRQKDDSLKENKDNNLLTKNSSNPSDRYSTNCVPPLHFSFVVDSDPENKSCLKRILRFIRCCK